MDGASGISSAAAGAAQLLDRALAQIETGRAMGRLRARAWQVGPWRIEQRHLGPDLEDVVHPAWDHLARVEPGAADLVVCCCDIEASGFDLGRMPWRGETFGPHGELAGLDGSDFRALWDRQGKALQLLDRRRGIGLFCLRSRRYFRSWERSLPLRHLLHWWAAAHGAQLMHAGAVGTAAGGALLLGPSGAGKSTTALACLGSRLGIAGDDIVLVEPNSRPIVHSVSATAKLARDAMHLFPDLIAWDTNPLHGEDDKAIFFPNQILPGSMLRSFPLKAMLLLQKSGDANTRFESIGAAAILRATASNTLSLFPGEVAPGLRRIAEFARQTPCFCLIAGHDLAQIPERIGELLARL